MLKSMVYLDLGVMGYERPCEVHYRVIAEEPEIIYPIDSASEHSPADAHIYMVTLGGLNITKCISETGMESIKEQLLEERL